MPALSRSSLDWRVCITERSLGRYQGRPFARRALPPRTVLADAPVPCFCRQDPFAKKDWYDIKAPSTFSTRNVGKTLVTRTAGTKVSAERHRGRPPSDGAHALIGDAFPRCVQASESSHAGV